MYIGKNEKDRAAFIAKTASGVYHGETECDELCEVHVVKGKSMIMKIQRKSKLDWLECIEYDNEGYQVGVFYEPYKQSK